MILGRVHTRRIGFVFVLIFALAFEFSVWGERATDTVFELQRLALRQWNPDAFSDGAAPAGIDAVTVPERGEVRALSRAVTAILVVIGALVWWESYVVSWAIASSLVALAALLSVSTMMLPRGVLVPTAGPGAAIIVGMLGRQVLEAVFAFLDRRRRAGGPSPAARGPRR